MARECMQVYIGDLRIKVGMGEETGVYIATIDPDEDGDVFVNATDLADAVHFVLGGEVSKP